MTPNDNASFRRRLEQAIAVQESLRGTVDDAIIDATIAALKGQLHTLQPAQPVEQQRKMVTILFSDVVNSTRLLRELDPEENLEIMDTSLKRMAAAVEARGGRVTRFMGDGFLAIFGLDQARENDPEMAVRAGLEVIDQAQKIATELDSSGRFPEFRVRVGINTGLVVAGGATEAEATLSGAAVNLAARLESAADPNTVLISGYTHTQVRGIFNLESRPPIEAKGFTELVQVFRVLAAKPRAFRLMNRGIEGIETRMVGRDREMQILQQHFRRTLEERAACYVSITGEAGLGKSRLLDEFETWMDLQPEPITLFKGRSAQERSSMPLALLRELFAFRFNIPDSAPTSDVRARFRSGIQAVLGTSPAVELNTVLLGQLLGYDFSEDPDIQHFLSAPQQLHDRAFAHLSDYFRALAADRPIAVFLDDIHWADESSLEMIDQLFQEVKESPVMFVSLARPANLEVARESAGEPGHISITLEPLGREDSRQLLADILQRVQGLPDALRDVIIGNAEGNPFYMEELVKMFLEDGVIVKDGPAWFVRSDRLVQTRIPPTLTGVIQARLESLPEFERTILQQASVIGRVFWYDTVCAIQLQQPGGRALSRTQVLGLLDELQKREILFERPASAFPDTKEYSFRDTIFRDVVYESVLLRDRKRLHGRVADWLIARSSNQAVDPAGWIAGHLEQAGRKQEAFMYLKRAARGALANYANEEAGEFFRRALAACPEEDLDSRFEILLGLEQITAAAGRRSDQRELLSQLHRLAARQNDPVRQTQVLLREAWYQHWTSELQQMRTKAVRARLLAEKIGDPSLIQQSNYAEAWADHMMGLREKATARAEIALQIARNHGFREGEGNTLNILGLIAISRGDYYQALQYLTGFLEIARELKNQEREVTALSNVGVIQTALGNYPAAAELISESARIASESGDRTAESTAQINYGWVTQLMGDWQLAKEILEPAIKNKARFGHKEAEAEGLIWLGYTYLGLGEDEKALLYFEKALELRRELEQEAQEVEALSAVALALARNGNLPLAQLCVDQIMAFFDSGGNLESTWEPLRIYWNTTQVLRELNDPRYREVLEAGIQILQELAGKIPDDTYRNYYLNNVPWHREMSAFWTLEKE